MILPRRFCDDDSVTILPWWFCDDFDDCDRTILPWRFCDDFDDSATTILPWWFCDDDFAMMILRRFWRFCDDDFAMMILRRWFCHDNSATILRGQFYDNFVGMILPWWFCDDFTGTIAYVEADSTLSAAYNRRGPWAPPVIIMILRQFWWFCLNDSMSLSAIILPRQFCDNFARDLGLCEREQISLYMFIQGGPTDPVWTWFWSKKITLINKNTIAYE